jgi:hypothetical protein
MIPMSLSTKTSDNLVLDHSLFDFLSNALVSAERRTIFAYVYCATNDYKLNIDMLVYYFFVFSHILTKS